MNRRILLIEDNPEVRENTAEILELANYEVRTASNGKEGVQMAREEPPSLIICDIMMPELDGYGVLHILSRNSETAGIPFIFLTAKAEKSDVRKGMNLGADDYLTKPFDEMELLDAIESRLKRYDSLSAKSEPGSIIGDFMSKAKDFIKIESFGENTKNKSFKKKDVIFREGDYANTVHYVISGKVKTYKINEDGKEYVTGLYNEGDLIGYLPVLEDIDYPETATVLENAEISNIDKQDFLELIYKNNDVSAQFIKLISNNLLEKEQELIDLAYNTVRKRVADALLRLRDKYSSDDGNFAISISRNDLASMVGTAQESVIRFLSEFKDEGLIAIKGSEITLLETEKLSALKY